MDDCVSRTSFEAASALGLRSRDLEAKTLQVSLPSAGSHVALDAEALAAGDVVLFRKRSNIKHAFIAEFQNRVAGRSTVMRTASNDAWAWTHVGILDENLNVWDATAAANVVQTPLRQVIEIGDCLAFRRFSHGIDDGEFAGRLRTALLRFSRARYRLRHFAGALVESAFPHIGAIGKTLETARRLVDRRDRRVIDGIEANWAQVICSVFVEDVLTAALGEPTLPQVHTPLPMHFAGSPYRAVVPATCLPVLSDLPARCRATMA